MRKEATKYGTAKLAEGAEIRRPAGPDRRGQLRTKVTKGPGSRVAGLAIAFKLIEAAQDGWRAVNGPHLVALVRSGV